MRAAFPPVSFSVWRLSSATTSSKPVFLRHQRATRLAATCLLFTLAMMMVPKASILETPFDEANTPTNEIVVEKTASLCEAREPVTVFAPKRESLRRIVMFGREGANKMEDDPFLASKVTLWESNGHIRRQVLIP